jgi:hypothetical protein
MLAAVGALDAGLLAHVEAPLPPEACAEAPWLDAAREAGNAAAREFDAELGALPSRLVDFSARAEETVAASARAILGLPRAALDDDAALRLVLAPESQPLLASTLNLTHHGKLTRALAHAHYTFQKRLSHAADSQNQRHRTVVGARPLLAARAFDGAPDVVVPEPIAADPKARGLFDDAVALAFAAARDLRRAGAPAESALYLLPNATAIRLYESGDLLGLRHKWALRLCRLAQREILLASRAEVEAVRRVHPRLGAHLGTPCRLRFRAGLRPFCPEGPRHCGRPVWEAD